MATGTGTYGLRPVSVLPEYQRQGTGKALIIEGLSRLKEVTARGCCLVGDPNYINGLVIHLDFIQMLTIIQDLYGH